ncbi:MAG: hypothetical protein SF339_03290 [Blastocatellia bacterium]|nr:hypothetical protein [Blastocatellia bacterium]
MKGSISWLLLVCALAGAAAQDRRAASRVELLSPNGLAFDARGDLYISDIAAHRIVKRDRRGRLQTIAGTGEAGFSGDGGPAIRAQLNAPHDLLFDAAGNLLIADSANHRIRRIDAQGVITTICGDGKAGRAGYNDPVSPTSLNYPQGLALDKAGELLIADTFNHVVRRLDRQGRLTVFAGSVPGFGGDGGPASSAQISLPMAVAVALDGSVYVSDAGNSRIRRIAPDGGIRTIAGYGPAQDTYGGGYAGDGLPAEKGKLFSATDLKCDSAGNLYIVDSGNHRLRVVRQGIITTIAGTGRMGGAGDGKPAKDAELNSPQKVALAVDGSLYLSDRGNERLRRIDPAGIIQVARTAGPRDF